MYPGMKALFSGWIRLQAAGLFSQARVQHMCARLHYYFLQGTISAGTCGGQKCRKENAI